MKNSLKILILAVIIALLSSCGGGGSNNDQGTAFSLVGFNSIEDGACAEDEFIGGYALPISLDVSSGTDVLTGNIFGCLNVQNNLSQQGIRIDRVLIDYYVPGASSQPPSTTVAAGLLLGPGEASTGQNAPPTSSLPPGYRGLANSASMPADIVPAAIMEYLNLNRSDFPELPFTMDVQVRVSGVTTAGKRIETNTATAFVNFTPDNRIADADETGAGTGAGTEGADAEAAAADEEFVDNNATE